MLRRAVVLTLLVGCERAEPPVAPPLFAPDAPEIETIESTTAAHDPPPPAAAPIEELAIIPRARRQWFLALSPRDRHVVRQICRIRKSNPCAGMMPIMRYPDGEEPDAVQLLYAKLPGDKGGVDMFCFHANGRRGCSTPLVVAFDGQPIEFTDSPHTFAFDPGLPVVSDWPTAATPWIALDRDGDGAITSGAELFGDSTGDATNGFEALAALDANRDGVIDRADPMFASLLLWADTNGDHRSTPDELSRLSRRVISIPLAFTVEQRALRGTMTWTGGTGAVVDVYVQTR